MDGKSSRVKILKTVSQLVAPGDPLGSRLFASTLWQREAGGDPRARGAANSGGPSMILNGSCSLPGVRHSSP